MRHSPLLKRGLRSCGIGTGWACRHVWNAARPSSPPRGFPGSQFRRVGSCARVRVLIFRLPKRPKPWRREQRDGRRGLHNSNMPTATGSRGDECCQRTSGWTGVDASGVERGVSTGTARGSCRVPWPVRERRVTIATEVCSGPASSGCRGERGVFGRRRGDGSAPARGGWCFSLGKKHGRSGVQGRRSA